jgi:GDP/UDP-N,N'-diacetylbacillosamine 2-epimerase (hydrolysing)
MRRVCYISGTRADFGLMARTLLLAQQSNALEVSVCVTGMHLSPLYGHTVGEIEASGLRICGTVPAELDGTSGMVMAKALGQELIGMTDVLAREQPEIVIVLGDRGEMLAGALAAIHLNIPIVHIHGGERSGTIDEPVRHAISKLSHYHFVATEAARERLIRMGEIPGHIFVTGAPGLDDLKNLAHCTRSELCGGVGFEQSRPVALVVFHPVLQEAGLAGAQMLEVMRAVFALNLQAVCMEPNSDAGGSEIVRVLRQYTDHPDVRVFTHLGREEFASWMATADVMIGNSSSGIIEAPTLGLPVVNVGSRQQFRERSENVIDAPAEEQAIIVATKNVLKNGRKQWTNPYGKDDVAEKVVGLLNELPINPQLLQKSNAY